MNDTITPYKLTANELAALAGRRHGDAARQRRGQQHSHLPVPPWANEATDGWVQAPSGDFGSWDLTRSGTVTGIDGVGSATARVVGTQRSDGTTTLGVLLASDGDPLLSVGDALALGRALIAAAGQVQD